MDRKRILALSGTLALLMGAVFTASAPKAGRPAEPVKMAAAASPGEADLLARDEAITFVYRNITRTDTCISLEFKISIDEDADEPYDYMLGYYGTGADYKPLTIAFDVNGEAREYIVPKVASSTVYVPMGADLGSTEKTLYGHLEVARSEAPKEADIQKIVDSAKIYNIFEAYQDEETLQWLPKYETNYYINYTEDEPTTQDLQDFIKPTFVKFATFGGDTSVILDFDVVALQKYKKLKSSAYNRYKNELKTSETDVENPKYYIRYRLYNLTNTSFEITFKDGTKRNVPIVSSTTFYTMGEGNNTINFLIDDLDASKVASFNIKSLTFYMDIATIGTQKTAVGSNTSFVFGDIAFKTDEAHVSNINLYLIIATVLFLSVFIGTDVGLYLYRKNKYKNDEFKRMNTRAYFTLSGKIFLAAGSLYYAILFIFYRATSMANTLKVYNPCDIPIVIFGVMSIIAIGYFGMYFKGVYKDRKTKKNVEKLKLDTSGGADDGTN